MVLNLCTYCETLSQYNIVHPPNLHQDWLCFWGYQLLHISHLRPFRTLPCAKRALLSTAQTSIGIDSLFKGIDFYTSLAHAHSEKLPSAVPSSLLRKSSMSGMMTKVNELSLSLIKSCSCCLQSLQPLPSSTQMFTQFSLFLYSSEPQKTSSPPQNVFFKGYLNQFGHHLLISIFLGQC